MQGILQKARYRDVYESPFTLSRPYPLILSGQVRKDGVKMQFLSGNAELLQTAFLTALVIIIVLLGISVISLFILLRRKGGGDFAALVPRFDSVDRGLDRCERSLRDEIARNREEATLVARQGREETGNALRSFGDSLQTSMTNIAGLQKDQLETFAGQLSLLTRTNEAKLDSMRETIEQRLQAVQQESVKQLVDRARRCFGQFEDFAGRDFQFSQELQRLAEEFQ